MDKTEFILLDSTQSKQFDLNWRFWITKNSLKFGSSATAVNKPTIFFVVVKCVYNFTVQLLLNIIYYFVNRGPAWKAVLATEASTLNKERLNNNNEQNTQGTAVDLGLLGYI